MKTYLVRIVTFCALIAALAAMAQTPPTTGLKLWLKADAITGLVDGAKVSSWPDSIGTNPATNATFATQPTFAASAINGKPAVLFQDGAPGGPNWLSSALTLNANSNDVTTLVVFKLNSSPTPAQQRDHILQPAGTSGSTWLWVMPSTALGATNLDLIGNFNGAPLIYAHCQYVRDNWTIVSQVEDSVAKTFDLYRDGVLEGGISFTTSAAASSGWILGMNKALSNNGLNGYIAEVLIYEGALDNATRLLAEQYLANKYGLALRRNLFTETFNTADTFNLEENLAARETGSLAPIANTPAYYSEQKSFSDSAEIKSGALKLTRTDSSDFDQDKRIKVTPNLNFRPLEVSGSYRLTVDVSTSTSSIDPSPDTWAGITIGADQLIGPIPANGFAILLRPGGGWQAFDGPYSVGGGGLPAGVTLNYRACLEVQNNKVKVFVNGIQLMFQDGSMERTVTNWGVANYLTLSQYSFTNGVTAIGIFDNFSVSVMPEPVLPATVILADNYNTSDTTNLNQSLPTRQIGTAATQGYYTAFNNDAAPVISGNRVTITNKDNVTSVGIFWPGLDFLPYEIFQSFRLSFKVTPFAPVGDPDCWAAVKFREPNPTVGVVGGEGFGILIRPTGGWQAFQGATALGNGGVATAPTYEFDLECRTNVLKVSINGTQIMTHTMPSTTSPNYVALMSFASTNRVDWPVGVGAAFDDFEFAALGTAAVVPTPTLTNPAYAAGSASFQFNSVADVVYVVEYRDDLNWPNWAFLRNVVGNGATLTVNDATASSQRFYRVRKP